MSQPPAAQNREHTRLQATLFSAKAWVFRLRRLAENLLGSSPPKLKKSNPEHPGPPASESRAWLYTSDAAAEFTLQAGKVHNLRVTASHLDGLVIPAGTTFSFWANVPRPVRRHGFVAGRELREGCIIPSIGGGLCQLSNALYDAALTAGCQITERHAHSHTIPGSAAQSGRDATIFWNYVDLRFRPKNTLTLHVHLTRNELVVRLHGKPAGPQISTPDQPPTPDSNIGSCETCGVTSCFRHIEAGGDSATTAWLLDAYSPEFNRYLAGHKSPRDHLFLPLDGTRFRTSNYRWASAGFKKIHQAPLEVIRRSVTSRRLASQGAARQRALLRFDQALADRYAKSLPPGATHLVVTQNLLPFLWRSGALGGRTFDVLMTRLPVAELQTTLDRAKATHPDSPTLADFRADPALLADESAALAEANRWITPHSAIAELACSRAVKLDWHLPEPSPRQPGTDIVFPASTLGRKGAYELREAARQLGLTVRLGGPVLESPDFWNGIPTLPPSDDLLTNAQAVVLPAWVEHAPRRLLAAAAAGIPVIASDACGLGGVPGVTTVPAGDTAALRRALGILTAAQKVSSAAETSR